MSKTVKIASLGRDLPDKWTIHIPFKSEYSLLDYDIVIFDTSDIFLEYNAEFLHERYKGYRNLDSDDSVHILEDRNRRVSEMIDLVNAGKTLIIFCPSPDKCYIDTGERSYSGTGRNRQETCKRLKYN